jgi:hypothetical protein
MNDRLNFFEPWNRLPAHHENQLTRALLVVLRCCPIAQQAWLSLINPALALHSLPRPTFDTQRGKILSSEDQPTTNEPIKGMATIAFVGPRWYGQIVLTIPISPYLFWRPGGLTSFG